MAIAAIAVTAAAAGVWFGRGDDDSTGEATGPVLADLDGAGPLTLAHFSNGTLYADSRPIPYGGPGGDVVDAGPDVLLRTLDGRVVRIDRTGRVTELGSGASAVPVVDAAAKYAVWPLSPDSRFPTHTGVLVWDLSAARAVGQPAFPFPPGPEGPAPVALDGSARAYIAAPDGRLWAWDREKNTYVLDTPDKVESVATGGTGLVVSTSDTSTNYREPYPAGLGEGHAVDGAQAAWSPTGAVAWFEGSDLRVAADGTGDGDQLGWPTDLEPGRIVWESGTAFVVLPEASEQPAIRCYVGNDDCRVVAESTS
ncbi:hypothetical protein [Nocardioides speluncae]|uniref:hypothetical protein n=1 Tax=Nocardioides speluncae TaxID=2670337 RepID=UPI000D6876E7|nr:hypothetical protein [Nocardioides speluncae]